MTTRRVVRLTCSALDVTDYFRLMFFERAREDAEKEVAADEKNSLVRGEVSRSGGRGGGGGGGDGGGGDGGGGDGGGGDGGGGGAVVVQSSFRSTSPS